MGTDDNEDYMDKQNETEKNNYLPVSPGASPKSFRNSPIPFFDEPVDAIEILEENINKKKSLSNDEEEKDTNQQNDINAEIQTKTSMGSFEELGFGANKNLMTFADLAMKCKEQE